MRRIAILNQKGGVGKTTTAANLGAALARLGRRVVVVDMDPQANLTLHLGLEPSNEAPSSYSVLLGQSTFAESLKDTRTPGLRVCPSNIDLSGAELELAGAIGRERVLTDAIAAWEEAADGEPTDYLLFDCAPSLGLLTINALTAAQEVFITLQTEFFALQGMSKLIEIVELLQRRLNPKLEITGILPCLYDSRLRLAREVLAEIRNYFPNKVFRKPIRTNVKLAEAPSYGQNIFEYAPDSKGALDHDVLAKAVLDQEESRDPVLAALPRPVSEEPARPSSPGAKVEASRKPAPVVTPRAGTAPAERSPAETISEEPAASPADPAPSPAPSSGTPSAPEAAPLADSRPEPEAPEETTTKLTPQVQPDDQKPPQEKELSPQAEQRGQVWDSPEVGDVVLEPRPRKVMPRTDQPAPGAPRDAKVMDDLPPLPPEAVDLGG